MRIRWKTAAGPKPAALESDGALAVLPNRNVLPDDDEFEDDFDDDEDESEGSDDSDDSDDSEDEENG